ncbi:MAG TPA: cob(I)yrinic acid a,c-diamide adenosyltransferase [Candidatus Saccharimonadales bacterium]|nr:cob(I)yrinic acid a,c-diamide adenosyltransferase [Candidatus Saccharimonadales bacterium]
MAKIYTRGGDKGQTGLPGERRVSKTDQLFEVLGFLDQTNAQIGLAISLARQEKDENPVPTLERVQRMLLTIGSALASEAGFQETILQKLTTEVTWMEGVIDKLDEELPLLRNFILVGGTPAGATLHLVRTSVRQTERQFHRLGGKQKPAEAAQYLNRLSDFFFQIARYYNFKHNRKEAIWKP